MAKIPNTEETEKVQEENIFNGKTCTGYNKPGLDSYI